MENAALSNIKDIILAITGLVVAGVGIVGLFTWRSELKGKAKFGIARDLFFYSRKFENDFHSARNPFTHSWEWTERQRPADEKPEIASVMDEWYARNSRLHPLVEDLQKLQRASWEAHALLNEDTIADIDKNFEVLRSCYAELSSSLMAYFDDRLRGANRIHPQDQDYEWLKGLRHVIYSVKDDELNLKIDEAVKNLAKSLRKYVQ